MEIPIRNYAHLGDAVWEVIVREYAVDKTSRIEVLHKITLKRYFNLKTVKSHHVGVIAFSQKTGCSRSLRHSLGKA